MMFAVSGCVSHYQYKDGGQSAMLHISGNTRNFFVEAYDDANCTLSANGTRLANFYGPTRDVAPDEDGKTISIPSGKPFIFTYYYIDARIAQNRTCGLTVSFIPENGKKYSSFFFVDNEVTGCDASISEYPEKAGSNIASFQYNKNYCLGGNNEGTTNGRPTWINWRVIILTAPASRK